MMLSADALQAARERAFDFLRAARVSSEEDYALTHGGDPGLFPRCIAVFTLALLRKFDTVDRLRLAERLRADLRGFIRARAGQSDRPDKPMLQAVTFTLSALAALGVIADDPLEDVVVPLLPSDLRAALDRVGALEGAPQSGNHAMFIAILLIHVRDFLGHDTSRHLDNWVDLHLRHMNRFGFWGGDAGMTHLQFQNGYHQYEIFEYERVDNPKSDAAADAVASLADRDGHFAPYPGGGGCFDYDAVFILTAARGDDRRRFCGLLQKTASSILDEQAEDGGFCESRRVRPRTLRTARAFGERIANAGGNTSLMAERLRYALALQRPKHDRIQTHWSRTGRGWSESNLWDTWFRLLALARIDVWMTPERRADWGFVHYPGLGHHG